MFGRGSSVRWEELAPQPDTLPPHPGRPSSSLEALGARWEEGSAGPGPGPSAAHVRSNTIVQRAGQHYCLCVTDSNRTPQAVNYRQDREWRGRGCGQGEGPGASMQNACQGGAGGLGRTPKLGGGVSLCSLPGKTAMGVSFSHYSSTSLF